MIPLLFARTAPDIIINACIPSLQVSALADERGNCCLEEMCGPAMHRSAVDFLALLYHFFSPSYGLLGSLLNFYALLFHSLLPGKLFSLLLCSPS